MKKQQFAQGFFLSLAFFLTTFWLKPRWDQYTQYYVDAVYTNMYTWYQKKHEPQG